MEIKDKISINYSIIKNGKINPLEDPSIDIDLNNTNQFSDTLLDKNSFIRISGNDSKY